ncbi:MAG: DUF1840 domain-containing protein [Betaproteobacteria bacterium]|nr:DUF1840 domain-containing protein [Betaproteobacteria bacterium]
MLIRFHSRAGGFTMHQETAVPLLRLMGMSGDIPGALLEKDLPQALERLKKGLAGMQPEKPKGSPRSDSQEEKIGLGVRAYPLTQLLEASAKNSCDVVWEELGKSTG